jgi:hypothetical protein
MTTPTTGDQPEPPYKRGRELTIAIADWQDAVALAERLRHAARKAVAEELTATGVAHSVLAATPDFPWKEETVRAIAREYGAPRLRAPQVPRTKTTPTRVAKTRRPRKATTDQEPTE